MDSNYVIGRLKGATNKYQALAAMRTRLSYMEEKQKNEILAGLKKQIHMERNSDIEPALEELVYHLPKAS